MSNSYDVMWCMNINDLCIREGDRKRNIAVEFEDRVRGHGWYVKDSSDEVFRTNIGNLKLEVVSKMLG